MKPLTRTQTACALFAILLAWAFMSDVEYTERLYVEPIIDQARHDELHKDREALNRLQEDWDEKLALTEIK